MFKLAMAQMRVVGGETQTNLARADGMIHQAAEQGAAVVLLPESLDCGWVHPSAKTLAEPIPDGGTCRSLQAAASRHRVYVCSGLVERDGESIYNSAVLINPRGEILLHHRKLNEVVFGHDIYAQGDRLGVARTPLGSLGLMVCADGFAMGQVVGRTLGYMGADVILMPSAWAVPPKFDNAKTPYGGIWRENLAPVARDFQMWIASVSNVGSFRHPTDGEHPCIGCSMVFDPDGREVLTGPFGADAEKLLMIDIEPRRRPARACGWNVLWSARDGKNGAVAGVPASGYR